MSARKPKHYAAIGAYWLACGAQRVDRMEPNRVTSIRHEVECKRCLKWMLRRPIGRYS